MLASILEELKTEDEATDEDTISVVELGSAVDDVQVKDISEVIVDSVLVDVSDVVEERLATSAVNSP